MKTLQEALDACKAQNLGQSACAELIEPFCDGRGVVMTPGVLPRCVPERSPAKQAILDREAAERVLADQAAERAKGGPAPVPAKVAATSRPPYLVMGLAVGAVGVAVYLLRR